MKGFKTTNEYADTLSGDFYEKCPKAVFAALAVSLGLLTCDEDFSKVESALIDEWKALHAAGIVPQKPINK